MHHVTIRPRTPDDDRALVAINRAINHDRPPLTVPEYRRWLDSTPDRAQQFLLVAQREGQVVGHVIGHRRIFSAEGYHELIVYVHPQHLRQGIGSALYDRGVDELRERGAKQTLTYVREDRPDAEEFARHRGFERTGHGERISRLEVESAQLDRARASARMVEENGIRITTLAELGMGEAVLRALWELDTLSSVDVPASDGWQPVVFEEWIELQFGGPAFEPEIIWVALDGDRPVGMASLELREEGIADNGYTGVLPAYRGRGIARALKLRTVEWAREHGIRAIMTGNDPNNKPMISINDEFGYRPLPAEIEMAKEL